MIAEHDLVRRVLLALADLSPSAEQRGTRLAVPTEWFRWLPLSGVDLVVPRDLSALPVGSSRLREVVAAPRLVRLERPFAERLAAVDQLRPGQRSLRVGWLFVAGRTADAAGRPARPPSSREAAGAGTAHW